MGLPFQAPTPPDVSTYHLATLPAFASPASDAESLNSPPFIFTPNDNTSRSALLSPRDDLLGAASVVPAEPGDIRIQPIMTPPANEEPEPNMDTIVGGALAPVHSSPPRRAPAKLGNGLRLPSFEMLGIAAPHPDRYGGFGLDGTLTNAAREAMCESLSVPHNDFNLVGTFDAMRIRRLTDEWSTPFHNDPFGSAIQSPFGQIVDPLTPPADISSLNWSPKATVMTAPTNSLATDPGHVAPPTHEAQSSADSAGTGSIRRLAAVDQITSDESQSWIAGAVEELFKNLESIRATPSSLKILSHALPSPSPTGHVFPTIVSAINDIHPGSPASPTTWINVFHAIPGRFNLADLPTSPPATPGPPISGESDDYFTQKVFDSAVSISNYQEDPSTLPRSPRLVVPPSSIDVSIVERYIPPSTPNEFARLFDPNSSSILVDRLVELSPTNGSLIFIYPTQTGARTFMSKYLSPILDPLLRMMVVVYGLSSDLGQSLGSMSAVDRLPSHQELERRIRALCATLTQRISSSLRFQGRKPSFEVSYAQPKLVRLNRDAWARDWWTKQEKPRAREVMTKYAQEAQKKSSNEYVERAPTTTELLQQLLDGVIRKPYPSTEDGKGPNDPIEGVEVSVFVIKRTQ